MRGLQRPSSQRETGAFGDADAAVLHGKVYGHGSTVRSGHGNLSRLVKGQQLLVKMVWWHQATAFCTHLNEKLNDKTLVVRLPTEAQWEYACRAGTRTRFYSGDSDSDLDAVGWYDANSGNKRHPVGQKKPNAFGLYDMHGNEKEWCQDLYSENYTTATTIDPLNVAGINRVLRGGSWENEPMLCRSARRSHYSSGSGNVSFGFRVIASPPPPY